TQRNNQVLIEIAMVDNRLKAAEFIGRKIVWENESGTQIIGKIIGTHGKKGVVKAAFKKGLPGQAIGSPVIIK
ncbi:MAG: 50S ribosomal protein L35ae, partial [Promethearchaeota archaeon]